MKLFGSILIASASLLNGWTAEESKPGAPTNVVVITTDFINRLVAEARTNNPSLKAADSRVRSATLNAEAVRHGTIRWRCLAAVSIARADSALPKTEPRLRRGAKAAAVGTAQTDPARCRSRDFDARGGSELPRAQLRNEITKRCCWRHWPKRVVDIGEQDLAWVEATAKATDNKYRSGQAVVADTLQIQNEVAKRNDTLRTDHRRLATNASR